MSEPLQDLNRLFGDRYRFQSEIGRGELGVVYRAEDLRYHREVAAKVLRAREAGERAAHRFLREIEIAAGLSHPHITPIFDSGTREGVSFFVMPLAGGGSLRSRLEREGPLPVPDAIRIASETLDALRCAHAHGVIHLDVKPENLLLSPDHALLTDFGISRVVPKGFLGWKRSDEIWGGTPEYMAPEQAVKKRSPDPRSDLYSVGCVLYEMLSGEPPFQGPSRQAILQKHLSEPPFPLTHRSSVSQALDLAVRRALEKAPADRYQTAEDFLRVLHEVAPASSPLPPVAQKRRATDQPQGPARTTDQPNEPVRATDQPQKPARDRARVGEPGTAPGKASRPGRRDEEITVWVVEDVPGTRADVQALIDAAQGLSCPLALESGEALQDALRTHWAPDVVIMDIGLPGMNGIEATAELKRSWPGTEVIMLTVHEDFDRVFQAFQAGAISYLDKSASDEEILRAVREAPRGGSVMTPPIARRFLSMFNQFQSAVWAYQLSDEDVDLLSGLVGGKGMQEIAQHLELSPKELEARLRMVHAKLHINHAFPPK